MNYHKISRFDTANGPGIRTTLWVAGCEHHCAGCHNQMTWDRNGGKPFDHVALNDLLNEVSNPHCQGLTLSGGDPLATFNREDTTRILQNVHWFFPNKDIWVYTGYQWDYVKSLSCMEYIDVLVDGKFVKSQRNLSLKFRGSENQRLIMVKPSKSFGKIIHWQPMEI